MPLILPMLGGHHVVAAASFDPLTEDAGLAALWDASDETSITSTSDEVSAFVDQVSSISMQASRTPLTNQTAQDVNGLNTIYFVRDFQNESLFTTADFSSQIGTGGNLAIHAVYSLPSSRSVGTADDCIFGLTDGARTVQIRAGSATTFPGGLLHDLDGTLGTTSFSTTGWEGAAHVFQIHMNWNGGSGGTVDVWVDGTQVVSGDTYSSQITSANGFGRLYLADRAYLGGGRCCQGSFCELALSTDLTHRADYESYLKSKWGIS